MKNVCIIFYLDTIYSYLLSREVSVHDDTVQQVHIGLYKLKTYLEVR